MTDDDERQVLKLMKILHVLVWPVLAVGIFGLWVTATTETNSLAKTCALVGSLLCFALAWILYNGSNKIVPMLDEAITERDIRKTEWQEKLTRPEQNISKKDAEK